MGHSQRPFWTKVPVHFPWSRVVFFFLSSIVGAGNMCDSLEEQRKRGGRGRTRYCGNHLPAVLLYVGSTMVWKQMIPLLTYHQVSSSLAHCHSACIIHLLI